MTQDTAPSDDLVENGVNPDVELRRRADSYSNAIDTAMSNGAPSAVSVVPNGVGAKGTDANGSTDGLDGDDEVKLIGEGEEKAEDTTPAVKYWKLYRYADGTDKLLIAIGVICSLGHGALLPLFTIFWGDIVNSLGDSGTVDLEAQGQEAMDLSLKFLYLGFGAFVAAYFQVFCFLLSASRQGARMRRAYFKAMLRQEMGWYDVHRTGELVVRLSEDVTLIQMGIADKVGSALQFTGTFLCGFVLAFVKGWQLALVILAATPLLMISGAMMSKVLARITSAGQMAYGKAGTVAQEVLTSLRTVSSLGGEEYEIARYEAFLDEARRTQTKGGLTNGAMMGVTFLFMFLTYALAFWYGGQLINDGTYTPGDVLTVFFSVVIGAMSIGQAAPNFQGFADASGAAGYMFQTLDRVPLIDSFSEEGEKPAKLEGNLRFRNIEFEYPTRPGQTILKGFDLDVPNGQTVALVGQSGCGKSTLIGLLERFYEQKEGSVMLDGRDIRELNTGWLRSQIGIVSQEPVLFATSIAQNISYGAPDSAAVTQEQIEAAARRANAHDFISQLPDGYETPVGDMGAQLSGGQKQRIAIARALVRNPRILLLDEATSALDTTSERVVQEALDRAREGRTTIVIAHRLSTIQDADVIAVIQGGRVVEQGPHSALLKLGGHYAGLVAAQAFHEQDDDAADARRLEQEKHNAEMAELAAARRASSKLSGSGRLPSGRKVSTGAGGAAEALKDVELDEHEERSKQGALKRAFLLNRPEWPIMAVGAVAAAGTGAVWPMFAIVFSSMLNVFFEEDEAQRDDDVAFWALMFVALACASFVTNLTYTGAFAYAGEWLTLRLRASAFRSLVYQNIAWFDDEKNSCTGLTARLSTDASLVQGLSKGRLGMVCMLIGTLGGGIVIAFIKCWRLAFIVLACLPLVAAGGALQLKLSLGFDKSEEDYQDSGDKAAEVIASIRTVVSLGKERDFFQRYSDMLDEPLRKAKRASLISGFGFALSQFFMFAVWAICFAYAGYLVGNALCDFEQIMMTMSALIFGGMMAGQAASLSPDARVALKAAARIFMLIDRKSEVDASSPDGEVPGEKCQGDIALQKVDFRYPTRPTVQILNKFEINVHRGQTLALVGESGCGKSTTVSLLERFYTPEGQSLITLDSRPLDELNVKWLRSQIGLVGQEPVLFATSIGANIRYGKPDATQAEVEKAATLANAHDFISKLPNGYQTLVGERGAQLSGGQKQRVAIARALIRNPTILLLDEATSALDSAAERVVQAALDNARKGRTTIVIAHRLSTIQDADRICVVEKGCVVEQGTHDELMALGQRYHTLVQNQTAKE